MAEITPDPLIESVATTEKLGGSQWALSRQDLAVGSEIIPWGKYDLPTDGLQVRFDFEEGSGQYAYNKVAGGPAFVLRHFDLGNYGNVRWVRDSVTGSWGVVFARLGSIDAKESDGNAYASGLSTLSDSSWWRDNLQAFSLSAWVKADWASMSAKQYSHISDNVHIGGNSSSYDYAYYSSYYTGWIFRCRYGELQFITARYDGGARRTISYPVTGLSAGFHNFCATHSGRYLNLYIDGELVDSYDQGSSANQVYWRSDNTALTVGVHAYDDDQIYEISQWPGPIDDFNIWDRALLPLEVMAIYNDVLYGPRATEAITLSEVSTYGDEIIVDALIEAISLQSSFGSTGLGITALVNLLTYGWVGWDEGAEGNHQIHELLSERTTVSHAIAGVRAHLSHLLELVNQNEAAISSMGYANVLTEIVQADETLISLQGVQALELVSAAEQLNIDGSIYHGEFIEGVTFRSIMFASWLILINDGADLSDSSTYDLEKIASLIEAVRLTAEEGDRLFAVGAASVALAIAETLRSGKGAFASESTDLTDDVTQKALAWVEELISLELSSSAEPFMFLSAPAFDEIGVEGSSTSTAILQTLLEDGFSFTITFNDGDATYTGIAMNTATNAVSEYSDLPFNSFVRVGSTYYGANSAGLYALGADTDDGEDIDAVLTLGAIDFTGDRSTRVPECFLTLRSDGTILLKTLTDDNTERWYELRDDNDTLHDARRKLARGVKSRYWTFTLQNIDGADFELSALAPVPIILKRRG